MPSAIRILDEQLTNMIAAGEVVERPASVVKELVENSLDALSMRILVETKAGGKSLIRVVDDGKGMNADDLLLALERHATSKIRTAEDLFAIMSMGFRGEAVPAIASVSKMRIASREDGAMSGAQVQCNGGKVMEVKEAGLPKGTTIEVASLFYNTPARRKFLKSASTELSHITDTIVRLALPRNDVYFELKDSGNTILRVPASKNTVERIAALLGKETASSLLPVFGEYDQFTLDGFVSSPEHTRSTAGNIYFFVNGRYVRDRLVYSALRRAYEGHILKNRYPSTVLFLNIDPEFVDVNVHPSKIEVRFRRGPKVYEGIVDTIRTALVERFGTATRKSVFDPLPPSSTTFNRHTDQPAHQIHFNPPTEPVAEPAAVQETQSVPVMDSPQLWSNEQIHRATRFEPLEEPDVPETQRGPFSSLQIIGQLLNSYIVCQNNEEPGSLVLLDQHAAHERILFEKLSADYYNSSIHVQALLLPVTLELSHSDTVVLNKVLPSLQKVGVEVEHFGGNTFKINAMPAVMSQDQGRQLILDCIERKKETGSAGAEGFADELLQLLACHSAVRFGQGLTVAQMREILRGLDGCENPGSCPHGRPTTKEIRLEEIERFFGRR